MTDRQLQDWDGDLVIGNEAAVEQTNQKTHDETVTPVAIDPSQKACSSLLTPNSMPSDSMPKQLQSLPQGSRDQAQPQWIAYCQTIYKRIYILLTVLDMLKMGNCSIPLQKQAVREARLLADTLQNLGFANTAISVQKIADRLMITSMQESLQPKVLEDSLTAFQPKVLEDSLTALTHLFASLLRRMILSSRRPSLSFPLSSSRKSKPISWLSEGQDMTPMFSKVDSTLDHHPQPYPSHRSTGCTNLLIVDDDIAFIEELQAIATVRGIHTQLAITFREARTLVSYFQPDIVLLNLCHSNSTEDGLSFLAELSQTHASVPVIVFTEQLGLADRVNATRLGAKGFLQKPIAVETVFQALLHTLKRVQVAEAHLLILVDDSLLLKQLSQLFQPLGFSPTFLSDPAQFWTVLDHNIPDLLIIDLKTAKVNGLDLCRVLRNDLRWSDVPIILLSDRTDRVMLQKVFAAGADEYVAKPIFEPELIARVNNRLERSRLLHELADTDSLTGLSNRRKATLDINRLIHFAQRQQKPLSFVIFDLDRFKQINDQYGHTVGDQVLRHTGQALKQAFRRVDVIARWGGDEFVLGLFDSSAEQSAKRMAQVVAHLHQQTIHSTQCTNLTITYSVGIAEYAKDGHELDMLYHAADQALYHAKLHGRDQICVAQSLDRAYANNAEYTKKWDR